MQTPARVWLNAQAMRLIASFCIVYIHLHEILESLGANASIDDLLRIGTDCFLVLTAFLTISRNPFNKETPSNWLWKRFLRIIPLYWVLTLIFFTAKNIFLGTKNHDTLDHLVKSLLFIPYGPYPVLFPGWSLSIILEFSIIVAVCYSFLPRVGGLVASLLAGALSVFGHLARPESPIWQMYTHPRLADFFFGGILAIILTRASGVPKFWARLLGTASFCLAGIIVYVTRDLPAELPHVVTLGVPAMFIVAGCLLLELGEWNFKYKWMILAARYTYCVYLGHIFWDITLDVVAAHVSPAVTIVLLVLTPVPVVLISVLSHHIFEIPLWKLVGRLPPWFITSSTPHKNQSV